jgi:hypothetical protein
MLSAMTTTITDTSAGSGWLTSPVTWTGVALAISPLITDGGASRFGWLLPALFASYLVLWFSAERFGLRRRLALQGGVAVTVYVVMGLAGGVLYELSLTVDGTGIGGLAADTRTSFLLLPGYLIPAVGMTLWLVRRHALDARALFFVAGIMSWYEMLTVGGAAMIASPVLALPLAIFYFASYAVYNGALGLLVVDPSTLWAEDRPAVPLRRSLLVGAIAGVVAWACFMGWSLVVT